MRNDFKHAVWEYALPNHRQICSCVATIIDDEMRWMVTGEKFGSQSQYQKQMYPIAMQNCSFGRPCTLYYYNHFVFSVGFSFNHDLDI